VTTSRLRLGALAVAVSLALAGCSGDSDADAKPAAEGGTAKEPTRVEAGTDLMQWVPAPGSVENSVTTNGTWFLTVGASGTEWALDGPEKSLGSTGTEGAKAGRITKAFLDDKWAVVVHQDQKGKEPDVAEVTNLSTGLQFPIDESTDIPTTSGGTWALGGDILVHATVTDDGETCVASLDLEAQESTLGWCAAKGEGFTSAHVTAAGTTLLTFDEATPACRTVGTMDGADLTPFDGVAECEGFDQSLLSDDERVWSTVPQDDASAPAEFYARVGESYYDLGEGTSGTLVPCAGAAYFVRDPVKESAGAQLVRWQDRTLSVVYNAPPGQSFLDAPRCGDHALVVTALSESGNEQVMAAL
jgi:hypothetical protein